MAAVAMEPAVPNYGCSHYKRKCAFVSPCCGKTYVCRLCHNENESHEIDRRAVMQIICTTCDTQQPVSSHCVSCGVEFGRYFCSICRMYDDTDKGQFHCELCGICRIGGRDKFFHCPKCDMCLSVSLQASHRCVEKVARSNCPVCLDDLHTSTSSLAVLNCGHITHNKCWKDMLQSGDYKCPLCGHSTVDMTSSWRRLDEDIAMTIMPEEYRNKTVWILCRDCHENSQVPFHIIGLKCQHCGSYNTCDTAEPVNAGNADLASK